MTDGGDDLEARVLVQAPTARDAAATRDILAGVGIASAVCPTVADVCREAVRGAGAVVLTAEAVLADKEGQFRALLRAQPAWSDLPLIVLTPPGVDSPRLLRELEAVGLMTLLKRPVQVSMVVGMTRAALRDRKRQYEVREHLAERERQAEALRVSEDRLHVALRAGRMGTWDINLATMRMTCSDSCKANYGRGPGEPFTYEDLTAGIHEGDRERWRVTVENAISRSGEFEVEYRTLWPDGTTHWVNVRGNCTTVAGERALSGVSLDVTARHEAEEMVRAGEERYRRLFDSMDQGFCVIEVTFAGGRGTDYRFVELNPAFERHSGLPHDFLGKSIREVVPDLEEFWYETYGQVAATGVPTRFVHHAAPLGRWFEVYAFRLEDPDRHRVAVLFTDVSDRKRAEESLRDSDRKKDDFIAMLAHELRNPLAPVRNGLQVLRLSPDRAARERAQGMMDRQLTHMVRLIDDLLDVSRISRNKMDLRRGRISLADAVGSAVETARPAIEVAGHDLRVDVTGDAIFLDADLTRISQVIANLLTNSAKYTERGGRIELVARRDGDDAVVTVTDNGIGIPAESLSNIFDMFSQVDRSIERSTGGLGIGLALVKGLVEMHGGTVTAASGGQDRGSTFTVRLPAVPRHVTVPADQPAGSASPDAGPGRRILVVDDNRDSAESMGEMLRLFGNDVALAHDGLQAVEAAGAFRPQVILMDVGMPRLNGYEATRRIREQPWGKDVAIVALTGWGQEGDRSKSKEAGCDGHLVKPVSLQDLQKMLSELQGSGG